MRLLALLSLVGVLAAGAEPTFVKIRTGLAPCAEVGGFGYVWVANYSANTIARVNPETNKVAGSVRVGAQPCGIDVGFGSVWVDGFGTNTIERIDPHRMKVTKRIPVGNQVWDVVATEKAVWASNSGDGTVSRIDPRRNKVVRTLRTRGNPAGLSYHFGSVWVGNIRGQNYVFRIDPATNAVRKIVVGGTNPAVFAATSDAVWIVRKDSVARLDPQTNRVVATVSIPGGLGDPDTAPDGTVWVPNRTAGTVAVIDPATNTVVRTLPAGTSPFVIKQAFGSMWVPLYGEEYVLRYTL